MKWVVFVLTREWCGVCPKILIADLRLVFINSRIMWMCIRIIIGQPLWLWFIMVLWKTESMFYSIFHKHHFIRFIVLDSVFFVIKSQGWLKKCFDVKQLKNNLCNAVKFRVIRHEFCESKNMCCAWYWKSCILYTKMCGILCEHIVWDSQCRPMMSNWRQDFFSPNINKRIAHNEFFKFE